MTNNIKMTRSINVSLSDGSPAKTAGSLSVISILAISVGMVAVPAQAQEMEAPATTAPVQATPVISPQPAPTASPAMAPTMAAPPASSSPAAKTAATPERADDLASKGGFDPATVAPEALAQIEQEQQAREDAAAAAAAARAAAAKRAAPIATSAPLSDSATQAAPAFDADGSAGLAEGAVDSVAVIPMTSPVQELAAAPEAMPANGETDWSLLAALAALLGIGSAGAYAAARRRKSKGHVAIEARSNDPLPASLTATTMSKPRRDPVEEQVRPTVDAEQATAQSLESKATTEADFAAFVASLPAFEAQPDKAGRGTTMGQRRVAAAPRPYLAEADLSRTAGYFTAHVDAMPTPQNPFLTRQKRIKRARYLDGKLAGMKAPIGNSRTRIAGEMKVSRPLEPAFS